MVGSLIVLLLLLLPVSATELGDYLSFEEIKSFAKSRAPDEEAFIKLNHALQGAFGEPKKVFDAQISHGQDYDYIRFTDWNIERGLKLDELRNIIKDPSYIDRLQVKDESKQELKDQLALIKATDIFTLNEVDWGIQRTGYRNIAKDFAELFNANYLFATEFLEVSPQLLNDPELDKSKYKGLHGNAIVSRFPIVKQSTLRLPVCYDWFLEESKELAFLEKLRRKGSSAVIDEDIISELRQGSRVALIADIELPNQDIVTVISTHLENRTKPKCREKQLKQILNFIKDKDNPVILAGDLNNFEKSAEPTSVKKVVKNRVEDPNFMARLGLNFINPVNLITNISASVIGFVRKHKDPTKLNIPVILPNKSSKLFSMIKKFEFDDGNHFDLSGDGKWSHKGHGSLGKYSNSNQIAGKGYVETFQFKRALGFAKYKIDWIFVKPGRKLTCSGKFKNLDYDCKHYFPAFGRTLKKFNESFKISDHHPLTVKIIF